MGCIGYRIRCSPFPYLRLSIFYLPSEESIGVSVI